MRISWNSTAITTTPAQTITLVSAVKSITWQGVAGFGALLFTASACYWGFSTDGKAWALTDALAEDGRDWSSDGSLVLVLPLSANLTYYTTAATAWTTRTLPSISGSADNPWSTAHNGTTFLVLSQVNGGVWYGADGISWSSTTHALGSKFSVRANAGRFVASGGTSSDGMWADDPTTWTQLVGTKARVEYDNGAWFAPWSQRWSIDNASSFASWAAVPQSGNSGADFGTVTELPPDTIKVAFMLGDNDNTDTRLLVYELPSRPAPTVITYTSDLPGPVPGTVGFGGQMPSALWRNGLIHFYDLDGTLWQGTPLRSQWATAYTDAGTALGYATDPCWTGRSMVIGGAFFFAVSRDGGPWQRSSFGDEDAYQACACTGTTTILLGTTGGVTRALRSVDHGANWAIGGTVWSAGEYCESMVYDQRKRRLLAIRYGSNELRISDNEGVSWASRTLPGTACLLRIGANGDLLAFSQYTNTATYYRSTDGGDSWTTHTLPGAISWGAVASNGKTTVVLSYGGTVGYRSTDNINWVAYTIPLGNWVMAAWNGRVFCAVAEDDTRDDVITSVDGAAWAIHADFLPCKASWYALGSDGARFYAFPYSGGPFVATSGINVNRSFWTGFIACEEAA